MDFGLRKKNHSAPRTNHHKMHFRLSRTWMIVIAITVVVIGITTFLIIRFAEPPLKEGRIENMTHEPNRLYFTEETDSIYRTEVRVVPVTRTRTVNGKTETYVTTETKTDRVFDHYEYVVQKNLDKEDWVITISAPSKKIRDKTRYAKFYVSEDIYTHYTDNRYFVFDRKRGDRRMDFNNVYEEIARSRFHHDMSIYKSLEKTW